MKTNLFGILSAVLYCAVYASAAHADSFGNGPSTFEIEFVSIGNPANAADTTGDPNPAGAVPYNYRIGKYEVSEQMIDKANELGGLGITKDIRGPDKPATSLNWNEAARFINWLNISTLSTPAYKFALQPGDEGYSANDNIELWTPSDVGYNPNNLYRNSLARYFLPSLDEWYKAAYFDPDGDIYYDYPTGGNSVPDGISFNGDTTFDAVFFQGSTISQPNDITDVGVLSPFGTAGQGGNVFEWQETDRDLVNNLSLSGRSSRGGAWSNGSFTLLASTRSGGGATGQAPWLGFRVASIPEPSTLLLGALASVGMLWRRGR